MANSIKHYFLFHEQLQGKKKHIQILLSGLLIKDIVWRILDRLNTKQERSDIHATPNGGVKFARAND